MKTSNRDCRTLVQQCKPFTANNIFAESVTTNDNSTPCHYPRYIVYSYGKHFPMYICENDYWYYNCDKYSPSTSKHQSQANPYAIHIPMTTEQMQIIAANGIAALAANGTK